jgi:hypothetical protein
MQVLVFDPNVSFARQAVAFITTNVREAHADMANNLFVLRKRLRDKRWDFVLADVAAAGSTAEVLDELSRLKCPVLLWSTMNIEMERTECLDQFRRAKKPRSMPEISLAIRDLVGTA